MKIFVTGGNGFVGKHVIEQLKSSSHDIYAISRSKLNDSRVEWIQEDLHNSHSIIKIIKTINPDVLIHLAWYVEPADYVQSKNNKLFLESSKLMFEAFYQTGGQKIIAAGTCFEYDLSFGYLQAGITPLKENNPYAEAKINLFKELESMARCYNKEFVWARLFYMYGPGENPERLIPTIINSFLHKLTPKCSQGTQLRDYIYVKDVAKVLVKLIDEKYKGEINISSGYPKTVREIGIVLQKLMNTNINISYGSYQERLGEPHLIMGTPLKDVIDNDLTSIKEGLKESIEWWKEYELSNM